MLVQEGLPHPSVPGLALPAERGGDGVWVG